MATVGNAARPLAVLMVEDNPGDVRLVREALREAGEPIVLELAASMAEGLQKLASGRFDAILLDLSLPDSHGLETVARVRASCSDVPVVVMTSLSDEATAIQAVAQGAQDYLVKGPEAGRLVPRAVRYAIERQRLLHQLAEAQKLEAVARLAGALAHEFNNLMMMVHGNTELLEKSVAHDPNARDILADIRYAGERATNLTRKMLAVGGYKRLAMERLSLNAVVRRGEPWLREAAGANVSVVFAFDAEPDMVDFDAGEVAHILSVLVTNACEAMKNAGMLTIATGNAPWPATAASRGRTGACVTLSVRDDGVGMSADVRSRLFEPFFKTKRLNEGTGLSLAGVHGTVREFGGDITVQSQPGAGSTFTVYFPLSP